MARYQPAIDIWTLDDTERAKLQPGQWIKCGTSQHLSRFYRQNVASTLAFHGPSPHATRKMRAYLKAGREAADRKALASAMRTA